VTNSTKIDDLEKIIDYEFNNQKILKKAQIRRAFLNENPAENNECMDPLATIGDAILDAVVVSRLYENGKCKKGELTECKNLQVKRERMRAFAKNHELYKFIQWGVGERKQQIDINSEKALDTVTEALIGAIYLDAQEKGLNGILEGRRILDRMNFFEFQV